MRKSLIAAGIIAAVFQTVPCFASDVSLASVWKGEISRGKDGKIVVTPFKNMPVAYKASKASCETLESGAPAHIREIVNKNALEMGLDQRLVLSMMYTESNFNHMAVSHVGASGLLQLMPATARRFGVKDVFDPAENIRGAMIYMKWLLNEFNNNVVFMLAGYNAGEGAVRKYGGVPNYRETINYVSKVQGLLNCPDVTVKVSLGAS